MPHGSEPRLPAQEGSGGATCLTAPDPASLLGGGGALWRYHVSHDPQRAADLKNKERLSCNGMQQGSHVSKTRPRVTEASVRCEGRRRYHDLQTMRTCATVPCYNVVSRG
jgi:hypothetical protein